MYFYYIAGTLGTLFWSNIPCSTAIFMLAEGHTSLPKRYRVKYYTRVYTDGWFCNVCEQWTWTTGEENDRNFSRKEIKREKGRKRKEFGDGDV